MTVVIRFSLTSCSVLHSTGMRVTMEEGPYRPQPNPNFEQAQQPSIDQSRLSIEMNQIRDRSPSRNYFRLKAITQKLAQKHLESLQLRKYKTPHRKNRNGNGAPGSPRKLLLRNELSSNEHLILTEDWETQLKDRESVALRLTETQLNSAESVDLRLTPNTSSKGKDFNEAMPKMLSSNLNSTSSDQQPSTPVIKKKKNRKQHLTNFPSVFEPLKSDDMNDKNIFRNGFLTETFEQKQSLGHGSSGSVNLVHSRSKSKEQFAIKAYNVSDIRSLNEVEIRVQNLNELKTETSHPNVVEYFDNWAEVNVGEYYEEVSIYSRLELCKGGSLLARLDQNDARLTVEKIGEILLDITKGLSFLHNKGYAHKDVKPANILDCGSDFKLGDLDFLLPQIELKKNGENPSEVMDQWRDFGDPDYQLFGRVGTGPQADVYALGITALQLLLHIADPRVLQMSSATDDTIQSVIEDRLRTFPVTVAQGRDRDTLVTFISQMLQPTPTKRITIDNLKPQLEIFLKTPISQK